MNSYLEDNSRTDHHITQYLKGLTIIAIVTRVLVRADVVLHYLNMILVSEENHNRIPQ